MAETTDRYERGMEILRQVDGGTGQDVVDSLEDLAPEVGRHIVEFAFVDVYARDDLSLRDRELVTISALAAQGDTSPQLCVHVTGALNVGVTREEVVGAFTQLIPYVDFPRVLNALSIAREVFYNRQG